MRILTSHPSFRSQLPDPFGGSGIVLVHRHHLNLCLASKVAVASNAAGRPNFWMKGSPAVTENRVTLVSKIRRPDSILCNCWYGFCRRAIFSQSDLGVLASVVFGKGRSSVLGNVNPRQLHCQVFCCLVGKVISESSVSCKPDHVNSGHSNVVEALV